MPRLDTFTMTIRTGERGPNRTPRYEINGFALDFDEIEGGNGPGETLELTGSPQSFPHSLALVGPEKGHWDIASVEMEMRVVGADPYNVRLGAVTLDEDTNLNLWYERPPVLLDV